MADINFSEIEKKWQKRWEAKKVFEVKDFGANKYYVLEMFPYPSGGGLHMGHAWNYTIGDILARFKIMNGFNVLHPMGYDSLGLPAENAAIEVGEHPENYTNKSIPNFIKQQKAIGLSYDWSRMISSHESNYYKWDQWIFLKMLEKGLAYQKVSSVNWCNKCNTVLANEQVENGKCWRHDDTEVGIRKLKQWFFKITDYADELYESLDKMDWPERTKAMQKNWIGKSHGVEIDFEVKDDISNVVIIHGCPSNKEKAMNFKTRTYDKHWIPWIKKKLLSKMVKVEIPIMPEPWSPNYKSWKKEFDKLDIDKDSILMGHSCGCAFLVRWLGETKQKIKKLILVAPWKIAYRKDGSDKDFYGYKIDKCVKSNVDEVIIFTSDNEEEDGKKSVKLYQKKLNTKLIELKGRGHFTFGDMGTDEFLELLEEITSKKTWSVFTTRSDTIFGVTFMVISAQHLKLNELVTREQRKDVDKFLKKLKSVSEKDIGDLEKEGVFTGSYAINPANGESIPIYAGNFVVVDYGAGMVMGVPAHDQRDFEFAKKYGIEIRQVISGNIIKNKAWTGKGKLINSEKFNELDSEKAKEEITRWLVKKKSAKKVVNFKLRDWGISRQRYWGTPIPIVYCDKCGVVPISEKDLPVELPRDVKFGKGNPLETAKDWINVKCPKCGNNGKRETDTMDTFVNSSWYFLRYCDPKNNKVIFDKKKVKYWCPVDTYIGGAEHACMHLIYSRFYVKFLRDIGLLNFDEPAIRLFHQGMLHAEDGAKMSKSKGNIVLPEDISKKYGIDAARLFLSGIASPDKDIDWDERGIMGSLRFMNKVIGLYENVKIGKDNNEVLSVLNKTIRDVSSQLDNFDYRATTIRLKELFDLLEKQNTVSRKTLESALKMLNPFCPHITEELWEKMGNKDFISTSNWPKVNESKISKNSQGEDLNDKIIEDIKYVLEKVKAKKVYVYVMPFEIDKINVDKIKKAIKKDIMVFAVNDSNKYDPENRAKKAKPGKVAIYLE